MGSLPKTMILPSTEAIETLRNIPGPMFRDELLDLLKSLIDMLQADHRQKKQAIAAIRTRTWRVVETEEGDFQLEHLENGTWVNRGFKYKGS